MKPEQTIRVLERQNSDLRDRLEIVEEEVIQLKKNASDTDWYPDLRMKLTPYEITICRVFIVRCDVPKRLLHEELYSDRDSPPKIKVMDVFIWKLRSKLKPFGIEIGTNRARGFYITLKHQKKLKSLSFTNMMEAANV